MQSDKISPGGPAFDKGNFLTPTRCGATSPGPHGGLDARRPDPRSMFAAKVAPWPRLWDWNAPLPAVPSDTDSPWPGCRVTLWLARIVETADPSHPLYAFLSAEERARHARYQRADDRKRHLTARGLLRHLLGARLGQTPQSLTFRTGPHGKPFIEPPARQAPLYFNISHSGDYVLIALSGTHEIGVDIEQQVPDRELPNIAARVFADAEYQIWSRLPAEKQEAAFYQLWTRHEAGLKALGAGFSGEASPQSGTRLVSFDIELPTGYAGALAIKSIE